MSYEAFLTEHFSNVKIRGYQATAQCRFHEDKRSSFSFNIATGLWYCFSGCGNGNIITLARRLGTRAPNSEPGLLPSRPIGTSLSLSAASSPASTGAGGRPFKIVCEYLYEDENKNPLFKVLRTEPKGFFQKHLTNGTWQNGVPSHVRRVPYRLPQLLAATEVFLVEGEKDVHKLESLGLVATTTPMGASNWNASYVQYFRGKDVIILPDNDPAGEAYASRAGADLGAAGIQVRVVRLPGVNDKGDVSDYLDISGNSRETLLDLVRSTQVGGTVHRGDEDPVAYFAGKGIHLETGEHTLPTEFRALCKKSFLDISGGLKGTDQAIRIVLEEADPVWNRCDSREEYVLFLNKMMAADKAA